MHRRIIEFVTMTPVQVYSKEEHDELCRAIGRSVLYGTEVDGVSTAFMWAHTGCEEIVTTYSNTDPNHASRTHYEVCESRKEWQKGQGHMITIGAVKHSDGKFGFHS